MKKAEGSLVQLIPQVYYACVMNYSFCFSFLETLNSFGMLFLICLNILLFINSTG